MFEMENKTKKGEGVRRMQDTVKSSSTLSLFLGFKLISSVCQIAF